jgi:hypothetical protein
MSLIILGFSNKKDVQLSEMAYFIFGYFSSKLGLSVDGHEQIII